MYRKTPRSQSHERRAKSNTRSLLLIAFLALSSADVVAQEQLVCSDAVANPVINNGPLQNPLKGFHTGFDASCCLQFEQEVYFGNYMATVGYQNFTWAELEPQDDQWAWEAGEGEINTVEDQLNRAGSRDKHVIVQINAEWTKGDRTGRTPQWFIDNHRDDEDNFIENVDGDENRSHKYEEEYYQAEVKELIAEFVNRYKDDPRIFIIQMGVVGYFGEFNVFPNDDIWLPENIKTVFFEHYRDHVFGEVAEDGAGNLVAAEGSGADGINATSYNGRSALTQVRYPAELGYNVPTDGIGYTNGWINVDGIPRDDDVPGSGDGNNDDDIGNKDFNDPISTLLSEGRNLWTFGPVGGEWPPNREPEIEGVIEEWVPFWGSETGWNFIERGHYSFARPPQVDTIKRLLGTDLTGTANWSLVPGDWNYDNGSLAGKEAGDAHEGSGGSGDLFREWHRRMGYNYQLSNVQHHFDANLSRIRIRFDVNNVGLAAFHFDWNVELAILDADGNALQIIPVEDADMRTWLPDSMNTVSVSADLLSEINLTALDYRIGLRMAQPGATATKDSPWGLYDYVTYVVISNDVDVVEGEWNVQNQLVGGWNILDNVEFSSRSRSCDVDEGFCFPVVASNQKTAMICL